MGLPLGSLSALGGNGRKQASGNLKITPNQAMALVPGNRGGVSSVPPTQARPVLAVVELVRTGPSLGTPLVPSLGTSLLSPP